MKTSSDARDNSGDGLDDRDRLHATVVRAFEWGDPPLLYKDKKLLQESNYAQLLPRLIARRDLLRGNPWEIPILFTVGILLSFAFCALLGLRDPDSPRDVWALLVHVITWLVIMPFVSRIRNARGLAVVEKGLDALAVLLDESVTGVVTEEQPRNPSATN